MISKELWLKRVVDVIAQIADPVFQEKAWIQGKTFLSISLSETACQLYDDCQFELFLEEFAQKKYLPEDLLAELREFHKVLDAYLDEHGTCDLVEAFILKDPEWHNIQKKAQRLIENFKKLGIQPIDLENIRWI